MPATYPSSQQLNDHIAELGPAVESLRLNDGSFHIPTPPSHAPATRTFPDIKTFLQGLTRAYSDIEKTATLTVMIQNWADMTVLCGQRMVTTLLEKMADPLQSIHIKHAGETLSLASALITHTQVGIVPYCQELMRRPGFSMLSPLLSDHQNSHSYLRIILADVFSLIQTYRLPTRTLIAKVIEHCKTPQEKQALCNLHQKEKAALIQAFLASYQDIAHAEKSLAIQPLILKMLLQCFIFDIDLGLSPSFLHLVDATKSQSAAEILDCLITLLNENIQRDPTSPYFHSMLKQTHDAVLVPNNNGAPNLLTQISKLSDPAAQYRLLLKIRDLLCCVGEKSHDDLSKDLALINKLIEKAKSGLFNDASMPGHLGVIARSGKSPHYAESRFAPPTEAGSTLTLAGKRGQNVLPIQMPPAGPSLTCPYAGQLTPADTLHMRSRRAYGVTVTRASTSERLAGKIDLYSPRTGTTPPIVAPIPPRDELVHTKVKRQRLEPTIVYNQSQNSERSVTQIDLKGKTARSVFEHDLPKAINDLRNDVPAHLSPADQQAYLAFLDQLTANLQLGTAPYHNEWLHIFAHSLVGDAMAQQSSNLVAGLAWNNTEMLVLERLANTLALIAYNYPESGYAVDIEVQTQTLKACPEVMAEMQYTVIVTRGDRIVEITQTFNPSEPAQRPTRISDIYLLLWHVHQMTEWALPAVNPPPIQFSSPGKSAPNALKRKCTEEDEENTVPQTETPRRSLVAGA